MKRILLFSGISGQVINHRNAPWERVMGKPARYFNVENGSDFNKIKDPAQKPTIVVNNLTKGV